jgi:hypothetical protein
VEIQILDLLPVPVHRLKQSVPVTETTVRYPCYQGLRICQLTIEIDEVVQFLFSAVPKINDLCYLPGKGVKLEADSHRIENVQSGFLSWLYLFDL